MIKIKNNPYRIYLLCGFMLCFLSACDLHEPTTFHENRLTVKEDTYTKSHDTEALTDLHIRAIAKGYDRYGDGSMNITVTYDPQSNINNAVRASENLGIVTSALRDQGIRRIKGDILPFNERGVPSKTLISYRAITAHAPDCDPIPGLEDRKPDVSRDYELGCSTETLFAKQIYRPRDLMGQSGVSAADGRRASNIIDAYRSGEPAEDLEAETISDD